MYNREIIDLVVSISQSISVHLHDWIKYGVGAAKKMNESAKFSIPPPPQDLKGNCPYADSIADMVDQLLSDTTALMVLRTNEYCFTWLFARNMHEQRFIFKVLSCFKNKVFLEMYPTALAATPFHKIGLFTTLCKWTSHAWRGKEILQISDIEPSRPALQLQLSSTQQIVFTQRLIHLTGFQV